MRGNGLSRNQCTWPLPAFSLLDSGFIRTPAHTQPDQTVMLHLFTTLYRDEAGFIVSAELVLIATILVIGLVVGLSAVSAGVNTELQDVGSAFGSVNQGYSFSGNSSNSQTSLTPPQSEQ